MGRAERRRRMRIVRRKLGSLVLPRVAPPVLGFLARSWRYETFGRENWDSAYARPGMLVTVWHGRMVLAMPVGAGKGLSVLVSPSDDGKLLLPLLARFGYEWVSGSSNKNPTRAVREMQERLRTGGRIVITPDGPRGPRHGTNPGTAWLARATGFPILPVGFATDDAWRLKSWDRFTIAKRRARVVVSYAAPIEVKGDASDAELAAVSEEMKRRMVAAEEAAFRHLGVATDW
jgi:lysophospholipid acyltransferase (LPLAT)-like uncharacterized protein